MIRWKMRPTLAAIALALLVVSTFAAPASAAPQEISSSRSAMSDSFARVTAWFQAAWATLVSSITAPTVNAEPPPPPDYSTGDDDRGPAIDPDGAP